MSRRRALGCCALVLTMIGACALREEQRARIRDDEEVPFGLLDEAAPPLVPPTPSPATEGVPLCFVEGDSLRVVVGGLEPASDLSEVVAALADLPEIEGTELETPAGDHGLIGDVTLAAGVARVDLRSAITSLSGDAQLLAIAQLVCTLTGQPGVGPVSFTLEGASVDVPRGDGSLTSEPVSRDDYADLLEKAGE
ncbi:MAG: GerMN domain-containing protein [Actinomycetota bacterium]